MSALALNKKSQHQCVRINTDPVKPESLLGSSSFDEVLSDRYRINRFLLWG
jgi:hypothetical protein